MISIENIFNSKMKLLGYREAFFYGPNTLDFVTGLQRPVLFIADSAALKGADFFSVHKIEDTDYDIYVVSGSSIVLFYLIDIKIAAYKIVPNGILLRRRPPAESDRDGVRVKYTLENFYVVSNKLETCTIFAKDQTSDPKT